MTQLHKRFTDDQVKVLLKGYCQRLLARAEIQELLHSSKTRFFALLKEYRKDREAFSVACKRHTPGRLPAAVEVELKRELWREKTLVEDKRLPLVPERTLSHGSPPRAWGQRWSPTSGY